MSKPFAIVAYRISRPREGVKGEFFRTSCGGSRLLAIAKVLRSRGRAAVRRCHQLPAIIIIAGGGKQCGCFSFLGVLDGGKGGEG